MASRIQRIARGSGHSYALDGVRVVGVTSVLNNALPKHALPNWYAEQTAAWASTHRELADALGDDAWARQATAAPRDAANKAANRGRDVHTHALELLAGSAPEVDPDALPFVEQAADFMRRWQVQELAAERPCGNTTWRYCGTFDLLARLSDGAVWMLDYKTGSGPFNNHALQLAAYAACDIIQIDPEHDAPMPKIDRLGFVMLRRDHWDLVPVKADPERLVKYFYRCMDIAAFHQNTSGREPRWEILGPPVPIPEHAA
jgi:PD-(D/E)XK nuclease superfamily